MTEDETEPGRERPAPASRDVRDDLVALVRLYDGPDGDLLQVVYRIVTDRDYAAFVVVSLAAVLRTVVTQLGATQGVEPDEAVDSWCDQMLIGRIEPEA